MKPLIELSNVNLMYELYYNRENSLKGKIIDAFHKRKFVEKNKDSFLALSQINLQVGHGERLGVIGDNGAGKSTLLKVLAGIIKPQQGLIKIDGPVQPLIEVGAGFNPELSGRENIYLNSYMMGFSKKEVQQKEQEIVEFTELDHFIDVPIKYYSTGMSVRLAFAIATSVNPHILLFDEMLGAGDASFQNKAQSRLDRLIDSAKCIVLVSHSLSLIESFCKRAIVLHKGKIIFDGDSKEAVRVHQSPDKGAASTGISF